MPELDRDGLERREMTVSGPFFTRLTSPLASTIHAEGWYIARLPSIRQFASRRLITPVER